MDLLDSLHELEDLVASSSRFLLTNKCLVNEEELIRLISNIRKEWPSALKEAEEINANRDKIIEDARIEAKNIIEQAKVYAQKKASENEITLAAEAKANEILEKTYKHSEAMRNDSVQYAEQVFAHMSVYIQNILNTVQVAKNGLQHVGLPEKDETEEKQKSTEQKD